MKFILSENLKMRDLRMAESSNTALMILMARHAHDDEGRKMDEDQALDALDDMDTSQFAEMTVKFFGAAVPKASGRP